MSTRQCEISGSPSPKQTPFAFLLFQLTFNHWLTGSVQKSNCLFRMIAQKASPLIFQLVGIRQHAIGSDWVKIGNSLIASKRERERESVYMSRVVESAYLLTSNTSKNPECRNSFTRASCSFTDGKLLVTSSVKLLFSVLIMFHIFFKLLIPGSRELRAQLSLTC